MADYFTHFSCQLVVGAGNIEAALAIYTQMARDLAADDDLQMGFVAEPAFNAPSALWLHDQDHGEPEHVIAFALGCAEAFDLKGRWGVLLGAHLFAGAARRLWRRRAGARPWRGVRSRRTAPPAATDAPGPRIRTGS